MAITVTTLQELGHKELRVHTNSMEVHAATLQTQISTMHNNSTA
jgi:hypothetical protein